jgi:hypothetical protein
MYRECKLEIREVASGVLFPEFQGIWKVQIGLSSGDGRNEEETGI